MRFFTGLRNSSPDRASGCVFYRSDNGVFLTEGVRGSIPPRYISAVVRLRTGEIITSPTEGTAPSKDAVTAGLRRKDHHCSASLGHAPTDVQMQI